MADHSGSQTSELYGRSFGGSQGMKIARKPRPIARCSSRTASSVSTTERTAEPISRGETALISLAHQSL